jgi:hypothetical protein
MAITLTPEQQAALDAFEQAAQAAATAQSDDDEAWAAVQQDQITLQNDQAAAATADDALDQANSDALDAAKAFIASLGVGPTPVPGNPTGQAARPLSPHVNPQPHQHGHR